MVGGRLAVLQLLGEGYTGAVGRELPLRHRNRRGVTGLQVWLGAETRFQSSSLRVFQSSSLPDGLQRPVSTEQPTVAAAGRARDECYGTRSLRVLVKMHTNAPGITLFAAHLGKRIDPTRTWPTNDATLTRCAQAAA